MAKRKFSARRMTRDIILALVVLSVAVVGLVTYLVLETQRDISERYISHATAQAVSEFRAMQDSIANSLQIVRQWGASGSISLSKSDKLKGLLLPLFENEKMLSGVMIADDEGHSYFILPDGTERLPGDDPDFDPTDRPWFKPALKTDDVYWTEQYRFHTLQQIGITASASYPQKEGKGQGVVAFDILLDDLYREIKNMPPSTHGEVFIFRRDELLLIPESTEMASGFIPVGAVSNGLVHQVHSSWKDTKPAADSEVMSFLYKGKVWWCGFHPLEGRNQNVWLGVAVPESDILGDISRRQIFLGAFGVLWILIVSGVAFGLSRRLARAIPDATALDAALDDAGVLQLIAGGENRTVEFKSTMRMNLHTKKPGKEIEMAWLKGVAGFLNTDGGTLLLGVTDDGEIIGLEKDVFENDDKCRLHFKNLIATHIGAELSKYIRLRLISIEEKTVGVVYCARTSEPVFLRNGNKESFYIRNGPSSDELPVSKALEYIKHRK